MGSRCSTADAVRHIRMSFLSCRLIVVMKSLNFGREPISSTSLSNFPLPFMLFLSVFVSSSFVVGAGKTCVVLLRRFFGKVNITSDAKNMLVDTNRRPEKEEGMSWKVVWRCHEMQNWQEVQYGIIMKRNMKAWLIKHQMAMKSSMTFVYNAVWWLHEIWYEKSHETQYETEVRQSRVVMERSMDVCLPDARRKPSRSKRKMSTTYESRNCIFCYDSTTHFFYAPS